MRVHNGLVLASSMGSIILESCGKPVSGNERLRYPSTSTYREKREEKLAAVGVEGHWVRPFHRQSSSSAGRNIRMLSKEHQGSLLTRVLMFKNDPTII
jgi:hypothetical protein